MADQIEPQNMIVYFIRKLIEPTKSIYLVVPTVCYRGIDEAGGSLAESAGHLGPVSVHRGFLHGRAGHNIGIARRSGCWSAVGMERHNCVGLITCSCWLTTTTAEEALWGRWLRHDEMQKSCVHFRLRREKRIEFVHTGSIALSERLE